jgi:hypothetical protein
MTGVSKGIPSQMTPVPKKMGAKLIRFEESYDIELLAPFLSWRRETFCRGTAVIRETRALEVAVIPAKAGIHSANLRKCAIHGLDSRFRGNDRRFEGDPIPNDTNTAARVTAIQSEEHYVPDDVQGEGNYSVLLLRIYAWRAQSAGGGKAAQSPF